MSEPVSVKNTNVATDNSHRCSSQTIDSNEQPLSEFVSEEEAWEALNKVKPYPNPKSDNIRASQKRVSKIREAFRAANTKENLSALKRENGGEYSTEEIAWTMNFIKAFYPAEYRHLMATKDISQPKLSPVIEIEEEF
jgi:(p)ppGpp synthase/HD superfamily hydrolase